MEFNWCEEHMCELVEDYDGSMYCPTCRWNKSK